jgi:FtsH-binding integral membrane protein
MADRLYTALLSDEPSSISRDPKATLTSHTSQGTIEGTNIQDPESLEDVSLVPGLSKTENMLRWGFIKKVYAIIACQVLLTSVVASVIYLVHPIQNFVLSSPAFQITFAILPLVGLYPLHVYQTRHPWNLFLLAAWTACLSIGVGTACTAAAPGIILEALVITSAIVTGLTVYAFRAARKGQDFTFMGPMLISSLFALVAWSFIQMFFPVGPLGETIYSLFGAVIFSGFIVYDTSNLIQKYDIDQYVWASVNLYLDILNLFLTILRLLNRAR